MTTPQEIKRQFLTKHYPNSLGLSQKELQEFFEKHDLHCDGVVNPFYNYCNAYDAFTDFITESHSQSSTVRPFFSPNMLLSLIEVFGDSNSLMNDFCSVGGAGIHRFNTVGEIYDHFHKQDGREPFSNGDNMSLSMMVAIDGVPYYIEIPSIDMCFYDHFDGIEQKALFRRGLVSKVDDKLPTQEGLIISEVGSSDLVKKPKKVERPRYTAYPNIPSNVIHKAIMDVKFCFHHLAKTLIAKNVQSQKDESQIHGPLFSYSSFLPSTIIVKYLSHEDIHNDTLDDFKAKLVDFVRHGSRSEAISSFGKSQKFHNETANMLEDKALEMIDARFGLFSKNQ